MNKINISDITNHKIMSMNKEKRERIINSAITGFTKGYKKASTDVIVKESGISKGLLFHYFNTKKELFLFLNSYSINILLNEFFAKIDLNEKDILARLWNIIKLKVELMYKYPDIFDFLLTSYLKEEIDGELKAQYQKVNTEISERLFTDFDTSLFKDTYDFQKVIKMVRWTLRGYTDSILMNHTTVKNCQLNIDTILEGAEEYMLFFRKLLYKGEV